MPSPTGHFSSELLAGQAKLLQLRKQVTADKSATQKLWVETDHGRQKIGPQRSVLELPTLLPAHLGWESKAFTAVVRTTNPPPTVTVQTPPYFSQQERPKHDRSTTEKRFVKLYPDVAIALLETGNETVGRIWLLLRYLDIDGRGWLTIAEAKSLLTEKSSDYRVCGWRQLRNLLNQGETVFWKRANGRIWLHSLTKVAASLNIPHLKMRPITLPIAILTQSIGKVRAHFYATFHSSRSKNTKASRAEKPISRSTIAQITQVKVRTQRRYEKIARVQKRSNYAFAGKASAEKMEALSWQHGNACFKFKDFKGLQGKPGNCYAAWQLPNSYVGPHSLAPKGKQKQINQALSDLFMKGMTGNEQGHFEKRYFANGRLAAKAFNRQTNKELYWYDHQLKIWHFLKN